MNETKLSRKALRELRRKWAILQSCLPPMSNTSYFWDAEIETIERDARGDKDGVFRLLISPKIAKREGER